MMRIYFFIISLLLGLNITVNAMGNRMSVRTGHLFGKGESAVSNFTEFCHDKDGYLWIGTVRGILRFDGNSYDIYRHDDLDEGSLSDNRTLDLLCDSKGRLWVATANGLNLYDRSTDTFRLIKIPSKDFNGYIIAIDEQADGTVTFILSGIGLYVIDESDGDVKAVRHMPLLRDKDFNTLECGKDGKMYIGDKEGIVHIVSPNGSMKTVKVSDTYIKDLELETDGNLIVNVRDDIYRVNATTLEMTHLTLPWHLFISKLSSGIIDGSVYVGTMGNGVWRIDPGKTIVSQCTEFYSPALNVGNSKVSAIYGGDMEDIWIGCEYNGILMIPSQRIPFVYRSLSDYYPSFLGGIHAISTAGSNLLVSFDDKIGMLSSGGELLKTFTLPSGNYSTCIVAGGEGKVLVGIASNGVWELALADGRWRRLIDIPGNYLAVSMNYDGKDDIFVAIHGVGVMRHDLSSGKSRWLEVDPDGRRLTNTYVNQMVCTADNKLWMGLYGGIACYDLAGDSLIDINQEPFLSGTTYSLAPLPGGTVLAATSHGLVEFHPYKGVIKKYTAIDGLADNDVRSIAIDSKGGRWIGTMVGLSYQDPATHSISAYHGSYGLVENSFRGSAVSSADGKVYFMNDMGITAFLPEDVPSPKFESTVKISALYLNGERVSPGTRVGRRIVIKGDPMKPEMLDLPYSDNSLSMRLSTMDFRNGANIVYRWRVSDISDEWIETRPGENVIYLPYLEPGTHVLQIQGKENSEYSPVTEMKIRILPPWYLSIWAKLLCLLVIVSLLLLCWTVMRKKKEEKINDAKIKFFIDVSHDIRSPITLILSPIESLLKQPLDDDVKRQLKMMQRNGQRILGLVNQLLDLRKLDKGKMRLSCRMTHLGRFVGELVEMFKPQAKDCGLSLEFEDRSGLDKVWIDRDNLDKILVNLISNAIKYTNEGGSIKVVVEESDDVRLGRCAAISVIDTGIGLDSKTEAKIFERFYRAREKHEQATGGFGIGLDLCRRLAELHHGSISGKNREDGVKGSVFTVMIPLDAGAYSGAELDGSQKKEDGNSDDIGKHLMMSAAPVVKEEEGPVRKKTSISKKVLVVDDHEELRKYLSTQLSSSYKVREAANGAEAMKIIMDNPPDIIVSDVMMPEIDGLELLKRVKSNSATNHIPVILLSSKHELADRMAGWDKGADGYLGKPFNLEELELLIETLIENRLKLKGKFSGAQNTEGKITTPEVKGNDEKLMERIMKVTDKYLDDSEFNVEKLASETGVSRAHLHRKMKEQLGMTPSDFIRNVRLRRACELLQKPDIEITQIAYLVGYTSQSHFSTAFKKFTGYTPSEYRARYGSESKAEE